MTWRYLVCLLLLLTCGCTTVPLRKNSVAEARAVCDMETQEVLDNLAKFVCDPNSMPYFSYPNQNSASVADTGTGQNTTILSFPAVTSAFQISASRQVTDGFTITPINDPRKLELMRCAYQLAVRSCGRGSVSTTCPDCQTRFRVFYTGDPNGDIRATANGATTSECLNSDCCWFHVGCKKCVPKPAPCCLVGEYCGVYVWVGPEGRDQLTKLTLAILDFAVNNPPTQLTKTVSYSIDAFGLPTTSATAVGTVSATVAISENPESLLNTPQTDAASLERLLELRLRNIRETLAKSNDANERQALLAAAPILEAKIDYLQHQLRYGALKHQYSASSPTATPSSVFGLQQQLQTLAPTH